MLNRPRRNRKSGAIRAMVRENHVTNNDLIMPLFVVEGKNIKEQIDSLPVAYRWSVDRLLDEIGECVSLGINSFILFPRIDNEKKDTSGSYALAEDNFYLDACRKVKAQFPDIALISDVALDPYNSDGHDGIVRGGEIINDETLDVLTQMAVLQAKAGFDIIGPSDMMDGRVESIRDGLDAAGFTNVSIMSYTAKYASGFYGPFRDALGSAPVESVNIPRDKKTYQMDPANATEALLEAELDSVEGADFLMVKPAVHYLDIIRIIKDQALLPVAAYHVSGECAMLLAACRNGWLAYEKVMPETLLSIKRAGADLILTYFAKEYLLLKSG